MALPTYASTEEKIWHYSYLFICGAIFFFLIAPIVVVIAFFQLAVLQQPIPNLGEILVGG